MVASLYQPACVVMLEHTACKEAYPALPAILEATAVLGRQCALSVMLEARTLRMVASLCQPACLVRLEHTACKEAHPALHAILEATAVLGRQCALSAIPATTIPFKEARPAFHAMLEAVTLGMVARLNQPACLVILEHTACKEAHPALPAILEATAVPVRQCALPVNPATTIPLEEARLRQPALHAN
jgi:hypothetical protein